MPRRRRSFLTSNDADLIANKLGADVDDTRAKHAIAIIRINGKEVGRFGIRRGTGVGHDYIPRQIHVNMKMALQFARCSKYLADYEAQLRQRGLYPT